MAIISEAAIHAKKSKINKAGTKNMTVMARPHEVIQFEC